MVIVVAVVVMTVIIMGRRGMGVAMRIVVMLDDVAARIARMRTDQRNDPCEDGAQQRQEYDCLYHWTFSLRMISEQTNWFVRENRPPLFRIMR
ncbi:hypothetical protein MTX20_27220 [Bradyrhizobium sp. ISRA435]|nr:hypothetical protein MTX20_27220 [Bradyrhizobium sp. ISRA435]